MKKINNTTWEAVIGLEIHAELKTQRKMFCGCKNDPFHAKPNENICSVCLGMPGALPVLNRQAIEWTILTGLALNCKVNRFSKWDRKNYFYPDLPKGYQISQYDLPLVYEGYLEISNQFSNFNEQNSKQTVRRIGITRIHLEEDTGTSKHPEGRSDVDYSLLDYNRSGVPLMELVTEPDIKSAEEAKEFCKQYQMILRTLGVADANMEKGQMRCEANISVRKIGDKKLGTKVEVKNLNSFKSVEKATDYEIKRQIEALESKEKIVQETRGWDEQRNKTYVMRVKETSADYRYFPEPDLPPIQIADSKKPIANNLINIEKIRKQLPELPQQKVNRYIKDYQLNLIDARIIAGDTKKVEYFEETIQRLNLKNQKNKSTCKIIVNFMINEIPDLSIKPEMLVELVNLIDAGKISGKIAKEIIPDIKKGKSPNSIVKEKGLEQVSDTGAIEKIIDKIMNDNPDAISKIKAGQMGVMGFLVGQIMRETGGRANPKLVNEIIRTKIK